jgi:hypothetical protein
VNMQQGKKNPKKYHTVLFSLVSQGYILPKPLI